MSADKIHELEATVNRLLASSLVGQVQCDLLLALVDHLAKRAGITQIEGQPLRDWFQKKKVEEVQQFLIAVENSSPALAAQLQQLLDESERRIREKGDDV